MATNVASQATDRRADNHADLLSIPDAVERSLNQYGDTGMRSHAQQALNASLQVGRGPDLYDQDGEQ